MNLNFQKAIPSKEFFIILLPIFFIFHGYVEYHPLVDWKVGLLLLAQYFAVFFIFYLIAYFFFRSNRKASVLVFLGMCLFFFFGSIHDTAKVVIPGSFFVKYIFILPFIFLIFILLVVWLKRTPRKLDRFVKYANLLLVVLVLTDAVMLVVKSSSTGSTPHPNLAALNACDTCSKPDIYFIVADEYAGNRELKEIFDFDNAEFLGELRKRGFHIMDSSVSNYNYTPFSIASILNMEYLQGIEGRNQSKNDRKVCYKKINRNVVSEYLKKQGYQPVNISVFQWDDVLPPGRSHFFLNGKEKINSQTLLSRINRDIRFNLITRMKLDAEIRRYADRELVGIEKIYDETKKEVLRKPDHPRFIYTHLMMPHYPYFFDSAGNKRPPEIALEGKQVMQKEYIEYLQYSNRKFLELFDHIFANSKTPPIIIFMGDHGFRHFENEVDSKYHFMILNSIYLPSKNYSEFYQNISGVNQFRALLNTQFNQQLPYLKDSVSFLVE